MKMSLADELALVDLRALGDYENVTRPIPALCIPRLTLQDGPNGLAAGDHGVTQLPASLGIAASFDPALAFAYGQLLGREARGQGIDVVQGPTLNVDRVPESGRSYEGYGEDPTLVSAMGVQAIEGIQSEGVMAEAKHFSAYSQETDRLNIDQDVSERALEEVYLPPFLEAVTDAHVAAIMCAYGKLNGTLDCADANLLEELTKWGFRGFVRSDRDAVVGHLASSAFAAGLDAIKPAAPRELAHAVKSHLLARARLDDAVQRILTTMFAYGLFTHPRPGRIDRHVATAAHGVFARKAAEQSMVLLKNNAGTLPLSAHLSSLAVIGTDAGRDAATAGHGGAAVIAPFVSEPVRAMRAELGAHRVSYAPGTSPVGVLAPIPSRELSGIEDEPAHTVLQANAHSLKKTHRFDIDAIVGTGSFPSLNGTYLNTWRAWFTPPKTGLYAFSLNDHGDTWFSIDGKRAIDNVGLHGMGTWQIARQLRAGRRYRLEIYWFPAKHAITPTLGMAYETPMIDQAVRVARHAKAAVVFVTDYTSEAFDRPSLSLPGAQDALINAVAKVNRHTIVVLNTGGAVLMPWIKKVRAVLEAWYPGEEDGAATAAVLFGAVDPAGRLPVTFPANASSLPTASASAWPGVDGVVHFSEGIAVGYRYDLAHDITPLFPFGYGLSYTRFSLSDLRVEPHDATGASVTVTNVGRRRGTDVIEAYLSFPAAANEPPRRLIAFGRVSLAPGASARVVLQWDSSAYAVFLDGRFQVLAGQYHLDVGQSSMGTLAQADVEIAQARELTIGEYAPH